MIAQAILAASLTFSGASAGIAQQSVDDEIIHSFDVAIDVQTNGDINVTETIEVTSTGKEIRRGIFRDLPRFYLDEGHKLTYDYDVESVLKDSRQENFVVENVGNARRIRIGEADVFLQNRRHIYELTYTAKNQVIYEENFDEVFWNATGNFWNFPIETATATVTLPGSATATSVRGATGLAGAEGTSTDNSESNNEYVFESNQVLDQGEGLTVAVTFDKGIVDPPSSGDRFARWWDFFGSLVILAATILAVGVFTSWAFNKVGRDPAKHPVIARYEPPNGYSPAAAHYIYNRGPKGETATTATLLHLAGQGYISIETHGKNDTELAITNKGARSELDPDDGIFLDQAFMGRNKIMLNSVPDSQFHTEKLVHSEALIKKYGTPYFKSNIGYTLAAFTVSAIAIIVALIISTKFTIWLAAAIAILVVMVATFAFLIRAPTELGQDVRAQLEGFRMYLDKAESLELNAYEVGGSTPPAMSLERYKEFLPYAVALDMEKPWTSHFEKALPVAAAAVMAGTAGASYYYLRSDSGSLTNSTNKLVSNMSSGVTSAAPAPKSSSSGGGGFSGGGGGGGGGGGW